MALGTWIVFFEYDNLINLDHFPNGQLQVTGFSFFLVETCSSGSTFTSIETYLLQRS
jgi:hypothetical protein